MVMFCQNSSRFEAPGKSPAIPTTAMGAFLFIGSRPSLLDVELKEKFFYFKILLYIEFKWLRQEKQLLQPKEDAGGSGKKEPFILLEAVSKLSIALQGRVIVQGSRKAG